MNKKIKFRANFKKYWILFVLIAIIFFGLAGYWFWGKFFPSRTESWSPKVESNFDESFIPASGWINNSFWTSLDFPGKQKVCVDVFTESKNTGDTGGKNFEIPVKQAQRAYFYPVAGTLSDFFSQMSPAQAEENMRQNKPYYIGHLGGRIERNGKNLFFLGENEKFLIPTKALFEKHFPTKEIPSQTNSPSSLPNANILVGVPEGTLLTDGKGVFVISQGKLFLIRSPEIFEAMGYRWEDIGQLITYKNSLSSYSSGDLINFDSPNPNGTILKNQEGIFLVWNEKLYKMTEEEQLSYFPEKHPINISVRNLSANCSKSETANKINCCIPNLDTRLEPPAYSPFANTLKWDLEKITAKDEVKEISWRSKTAANKENTLKRLKSLKNFILYSSGIVK